MGEGLGRQGQGEAGDRAKQRWGWEMPVTRCLGLPSPGPPPSPALPRLVLFALKTFLPAPHPCPAASTGAQLGSPATAKPANPHYRRRQGGHLLCPQFSEPPERLRGSLELGQQWGRDRRAVGPPGFPRQQTQM